VKSTKLPGREASDLPVASSDVPVASIESAPSPQPRAEHSTTKTLTLPAKTCPDCGERFADEETFDAHQRSEADRHPPSVRFLKGAPLPKCLNPSTLYSIGWQKPKPPRKPLAQGVWRKPPMPKRRPHRIDENETWNCLACQKKFKDATPFLAHFVHTHTPIERCLDADELKALDYEQGSNGVWRASIATQLLPSQANRLATVRQELAAFEDSTLAGGYSGTPPNNPHEITPLESGTCEGTFADREPTSSRSCERSKATTEGVPAKPSDRYNLIARAALNATSDSFMKRGPANRVEKTERDPLGR
jgi:hypothetical protein